MDALKNKLRKEQQINKMLFQEASSQKEVIKELK